jgi:hypothetical protein
MERNYMVEKGTFEEPIKITEEEIKYKIDFERTDNGNIHSQGLTVDKNHYLIAEEGNVIECSTRIKVFECAREIIRDKKYPKSISLELTINQ